jgi:small-conductance mechanosensitive channel
MQQFLDLLLDNETGAGRLVTGVVVVAVALLVDLVLGRIVVRRTDDAYARFYNRKFVRYGVAAATLVLLAFLLQGFAGRAATVLGLATAGLAFALQEVIGALAGFVNILSGRIFRVGDRIQMGGVRGDVIDITPLRTKIMEMGSAAGDETWVRGRQYTGRIVVVSNKATFTKPVFNYSGVFEYIWEELNLPVPYRDDWHAAERILREEVQRVSAGQEARQAIDAMAKRYYVGRSEVEPRVFVRATDDWVELSARFVVPVRSARKVKDEVSRRVLDRFGQAGITIASATQDVTVRTPDGEPR